MDGSGPDYKFVTRAFSRTRASLPSRGGTPDMTYGKRAMVFSGPLSALSVMAINWELFWARVSPPTPPTIGASSNFQDGGQFDLGIIVTSAPVSIRKGMLMTTPFEALWREQVPHTTGGLSHVTARATPRFQLPGTVPAVPGTVARQVGPMAEL